MSRPRLPSRREIADHWEGKHQKIWGEAEDYCFACGDHYHLERAHIVPRHKGGKDTVENLHILCAACHKESEAIGNYWHWFNAKKAQPYERHMARRIALMCPDALWAALGSKMRERGLTQKQFKAGMKGLRGFGQ